MLTTAYRLLIIILLNRVIYGYKSIHVQAIHDSYYSFEMKQHRALEDVKHYSSE